MVRKILRKFQPNFQHYVKKIEAQAKKWFSYKKKTGYSSLLENMLLMTS